MVRPLAAVVDLGTNAARLAMATLDESGKLVPKGRWRELIRLGEGLSESGKLSDDAMRRGIGTLRRFLEIIEENSADKVDAVATSALRDASNGAEFIAGAKELGIPLRVISAEEEARLALAGVMASMDERAGEIVVFDIGGGSLEIIHSRGGPVSGMVSLPAGVVYLTEHYLRDIPTPPDQVEACAARVCGMLGNVRPGEIPLEDLSAASLIGCGGVVALAWFVRGGAPGLEGIGGSALERGEIGEWVLRFSRLSFEERRALPGFEPGREDVALAILIVVREIMGWLSKSTLQVSTGGVREGRLLELLRE